MPDFELQSTDIPMMDVLDACVFGIIIIDAEYRIVVWNTWLEQHTLIKKDVAVGRGLFKLFSEMKNTRMQQAVDSAIENSTSAYLSQALNKHPFPLRNPEKHNERLQQSMSIKPISLADESRCCMVQIEDVTASVNRANKLRLLREQAENDRKIAQNLVKMKTSFLSTVSHELRTPLTSITGSLNLIINRVTGDIPEKAMDMIVLARRNSYRLLQLVNDILDLDKIESGMMSYDVETINVKSLLQQAIDDNNGLAAKLGVSFQLKECNDYLHVEADYDRLMQVMTNLMSNAAKFSPAESEITINACLYEDNVRISVTDNGPGISEKFRVSLFDKFTQDKDGENTHPGGTGLGLSICQSIIQFHGGNIDFVCPKQGGTTFFFELKAVNSV